MKGCLGVTARVAGLVSRDFPFTEYTYVKVSKTFFFVNLSIEKLRGIWMGWVQVVNLELVEE